MSNNKRRLNVLVIYEFFEKVSRNISRSFSEQLTDIFDVKLFFLTPASIFTFEKAITDYSKMITENSIDAVLCNEDSAIMIASILKKEHPHLLVPDLEVIFLCQHKLYTHEYVDTSEKPINTYAVDCEKDNFEDDVLRIEEQVGYPCVVKPCLGTTSYGVFKCCDERELMQALRFHASKEGYKLFGHLIGAIEQHIDTKRFPMAARVSVLVQSMVRQLDGPAAIQGKGERYTLYETECCIWNDDVIIWPSLEAVYHLHNGTQRQDFYPAFQMPVTHHQKELEHAIRRDAQRLSELGFKRGIVHGEYFVSDSGDVKLLELNPRLCGAARGMYLRAMGRHADNYSASLLVQVGVRPNPPGPCERYALSHYVSSTAKGPVGNFLNVEEKFAQHEVVFNVDLCGEFECDPGVDFQHAVYLNLIGDDFDACRERLEEIRRRLIKKEQFFPWRYLSEEIVDKRPTIKAPDVSEGSFDKIIDEGIGSSCDSINSSSPASELEVVQ